jgi:glutamate dehydrogenase/leucine dehydrogenase
MITGFGVAEAVKHFYNVQGESVLGKRAIVQGFGNVGAAAAFYLAQMGAKVVGIIDIVGGLIKEEGFSFEEITELYLAKSGNTLVSDHLIPFSEINENIWKLETEIFAPCAASRLITQNQIDQMIGTGLEVISCGANVPFADKEIFFGSIMEHTDNKVSLIPDFISNCGMARVFAYFMERKVLMNDEAIFNDTSEVIQTAIQNVYDKNQTRIGISATAFEIALTQLV